MISLTETELREKDERLRLALVATGLGTWEMDLVHNLRHWSDETFAMHGLTRTQANDAHMELNDQVMHPEDRDRLLQLHDELRKGRDDYLFEYRTTLPNGSVRWISARGKVLERQSDGPIRIVGVTSDITEQKHLRQVQDRQDAQFRLLADALPQLVWVADAKGKVTYYNQRRQQYFEEPQANTSDPQWQPLIHRDDLSKTIASWAHAMQNCQDYEMEHRLRMADGHYRWHLSRATPSLGLDGLVASWFGTATDIDHLIETAAQVKLLDERLATAEEGAGALVYDWDVQSNHVWRSNSLKVILGWEPHEIEPNSAAWHRLMHPDDLARLSAEKPAGLTDQDDHYIAEYRIRHKDGRYRWMIDSGRVFRDESGTVIRQTGTTLDISVRKQLEMSEQRMARLIDLSFEPIFVWHPKAGIIEWNRGAELLYGYSRAEALGQLPQALLQTRYPVPTAQFMEILHDQLDWSGELQNFDKAGKLVEVESRYQVIQFDNEMMVLESNRDIRERKLGEDSVARMAAVAAASHDALYGANLDGIIEAWNPGAHKLLGYPEHQAIGQHIALLADPSRHAEQLDFLRRLAAGETIKPFDTVRKRQDGKLIDVSMAMAPVKAADGEVIAISVALHDIGERKEWESRQRLMNRELAHRVKNSFAILQAILRSTLRSTPDPAQFATAFSGRLHSMAAAHDVLTENDWRGAELGALLRHQLSHYVTGQRIRISGGIVNLAAEHAAPFSLIFNELATNAVKYGALSVPQGRIDVSWLIAQVYHGGGKLVLTWQESGGPPVTKQGQQGFGMTLIEKSLANAVVDMEFKPEGLTCTLTWPITKNGEQLAPTK